MFLNAHVIGFHYGYHIIVTSELIHASLNRLIMSFRFTQRFHTPGHASKGIDTSGAFCYAPVGANYAIIAVLLTQQVRNDVFVVGISHILPVFSVDTIGNGVIGHNRGGHSSFAVQLKGSFGEGLYVILQIITGINSKGSISKMCIPASLFRTSAGPVLNHGIHTVIAPAIQYLLFSCGCLKTIHIGTCQVGGQIGIFSHGTAEATPAWLAGKIDLGRKGSCNSQGPVFNRSNLSKLFHQLWIKGGCNSALAWIL